MPSWFQTASSLIHYFYCPLQFGSFSLSAVHLCYDDAIARCDSNLNFLNFYYFQFLCANWGFWNYQKSCWFPRIAFNSSHCMPLQELIFRLFHCWVFAVENVWHRSTCANFYLVINSFSNAFWVAIYYHQPLISQATTNQY
jgi:hypothetical protein